MRNLIARLTDRDDQKAYEYTKEIIAASALSDEYYSALPIFSGLLNDKKSYIRTRGFMLCCAQAKWDKENKLQIYFPQMMALLNDDKPTVVRQCLKALKEVVLYCPALCGRILSEMETMDLTKYKDSMAPLIQRDINALKEIMLDT